MFGMIPKINSETGLENRPEDLCALCPNYQEYDNAYKCKFDLPVPELVELEFMGEIKEVNYICEGFPI